MKKSLKDYIHICQKMNMIEINDLLNDVCNNVQCNQLQNKYKQIPYNELSSLLNLKNQFGGYCAKNKLNDIYDDYYLMMAGYNNKFEKFLGTAIKIGKSAAKATARTALRLAKDIVHNPKKYILVIDQAFVFAFQNILLISLTGLKQMSDDDIDQVVNKVKSYINKRIEILLWPVQLETMRDYIMNANEVIYSLIGETIKEAKNENKSPVQVVSEVTKETNDALQRTEPEITEFIKTYGPPVIKALERQMNTLGLLNNDHKTAHNLTTL